MNRLLARSLSFFNGTIAVMLVVLGILYGYGFDFAHAGLASVETNALLSTRIIGGACGAFLGFLWACLLCGTVSILILMERHLRRIASMRPAGSGLPALPRPAQAERPAPQQDGRIEPTL